MQLAKQFRLPAAISLVLIVLALLPVNRAFGAELADLIARVKLSVVAIGTEERTRRPPVSILGTGFALGDGHQVVTNAHVVPDRLADARNERLVVLVGSGARPEIRGAQVVALDRHHDTAILAIEGDALPPLQLATSPPMREGHDILFVGYPIGNVLGLYPVAHRGIISAIAPHAIPLTSSRQLNPARIRALRNPYLVYQLDATAYPGNSGSPLIDVTSGMVVGIINSVVVKSNKESVLSDPSAITYAIPARHIDALLRE